MFQNYKHTELSWEKGEPAHTNVSSERVGTNHDFFNRGLSRLVTTLLGNWRSHSAVADCDAVGPSAFEALNKIPLLIQRTRRDPWRFCLPQPASPASRVHALPALPSQKQAGAGIKMARDVFRLSWQVTLDVSKHTWHELRLTCRPLLIDRSCPGLKRPVEVMAEPHPWHPGGTSLEGEGLSNLEDRG